MLESTEIHSSLIYEQVVGNGVDNTLFYFWRDSLMITAGDFRQGVTIEWEGGVWTIVDFQHVKPGKGAAFVRTKLKNVMTGAVVERSFNPTDKQPRATIETKEMQYVYNDGEF